MINIWSHIMQRILGVDYDMSKHMINTEHKWDLYMDNTVNNTMIKHSIFHGYIFEILQYPERRMSKWLEHSKNPFYSRETQDKWIKTYCKTQQVYFAFVKFARLWKVNHANISVTTDLCMNDLSTNSRNTIKIYQSGSIYYFALNELVHICTTALINAPDFFTTPLHPKNPYTNVPFSDAILLHIYLSMRYSNLKISNILHYFYQSSFDISILTVKYESELRNEYIEYFCKYGDVDERLDYMFDMLSQYNIVLFKRFWKNDGFPKKILLDAMFPFIHFYIRLNYSVMRVNKLVGTIYLKQELFKFEETNYKFGRSILVKTHNMFFTNTSPRYTRDTITEYIRHTVDMKKLTDGAIFYDGCDDSTYCDDESVS